MDMLEFLRGRRSYRRFTQEPVPQQVLDDALEAARICNCGRNQQALRYITVQSPEMVAKIQPWVHWAAALPPEQGQPKPDEMPTAFIAVLQDTGVANFGDVSVGLAMGNILSTAWAHGVGSCILGAINRPVISELLAIPENTKLCYVIALGYPSHKSHIVDVQHGNMSYYLDENRDYCVPKLGMDKILIKQL